MKGQMKMIRLDELTDKVLNVLTVLDDLSVEELQALAMSRGIESEFSPEVWATLSDSIRHKSLCLSIKYKVLEDAVIKRKFGRDYALAYLSDPKNCSSSPALVKYGPETD